MAHLGYDTSPAHIHCVKLASAGTILQRKMGYLACSLLVASSDQLSLLLTNTVLRDLASTNMSELQIGLVARDVAAVVGLVTRQLSPEVEEAMEEDKVEGGDDGEERDWTLSFLDTLVLDSLAKGQLPYRPRNSKADLVEGSSVSLQPANHTMGRISACFTESISMDFRRPSGGYFTNP